MKSFISLSLLFLATTANAVGGMIGGGEVSYKPLLQCTIMGNTAGSPRVSQIQVVKETDFDGRVLEDANLRIVVLDQYGKPSGFYVTHVSSLAIGGPLRLPIWRHEQGSSGNFQIGLLTLDSELTSGSFRVNDTGFSGQLSLSNCRLADDFGS